MFRFGLILAVAVLVLDQISKWWILGPMAFSPAGCREIHLGCGFVELTPIFDLRMVWNEGVSFGLLSANSDFGRWALVLLQGGIAAFFLYWMRTAARPLTATALGLVIGGALGNVVDRIRFGAVVDFLDFTGLGFPWVFNVADAAINVGAGLLLLDFLLNSEKKSGTETKPEGAPQNGPDQA
ncbi:MAG: signal peptidase II [Caulobacterales bacterium]